MGVDVQRHSPAALSQGKTRYRRQGWMGAENLALTWTVQPVASRYTDRKETGQTWGVHFKGLGYILAFFRAGHFLSSSFQSFLLLC